MELKITFDEWLVLSSSLERYRRYQVESYDYCDKLGIPEGVAYAEQELAKVAGLRTQLDAVKELYYKSLEL